MCYANNSWERTMNRAQQDKFRKMLTETADRVSKTAAGLVETVRTPTGGESAGGISNAPLHLGDIGSEAYNQELGVTLLENETYIRDEALAALDRLKKGAFGRCESCGGDIPQERLEAIAYTRYCAPCANKIQAGRPVNMNEGRPASWLGEPGHEGLDVTGSPAPVAGRDLGHSNNDIYAVGTAGGGTAVGGLAGTNVGDGSPANANLEEATGGADSDVPGNINDDIEMSEAYAGPSGGAVGGTPANKRAVGGQAHTTRSGGTSGKDANVAKDIPGPRTSRDTKATKTKGAKETKGTHSRKRASASGEKQAKKSTRKKKG
jgi:RNA polymerase-binding transcription factor DksA